jgi:hypothetical protein
MTKVFNLLNAEKGSVEPSLPTQKITLRSDKSVIAGIFRELGNNAPGPPRESLRYVKV